jgi:hypothetical protein
MTNRGAAHVMARTYFILLQLECELYSSLQEDVLAMLQSGTILSGIVNHNESSLRCWISWWSICLFLSST